MEDWVETEEEKGYGDMTEMETPYYSVKYQYKDNTRSLTDNIREYLINVEADTILYFMDNMPSEWIPEEGGQVVCNCCIDFPMGLVNKVLSVERQAGMIKVTTTPCELKDAYDDFQLDLDMDLISSNNSDMIQTKTVTAPGTRSGVSGPTTEIIYDWTIFNLASKDEKIVCRNGVLTRSSDAQEEDYFKQDINSDVTETNEIKIISLDQDSYPLKLAFTDKVKKFVDKAEIGVYYVSKARVIKKIRVKEEYDYTKQIETTGIKLSVDVGKNGDIIAPKSDKVKRAEQEDEFIKRLMDAGMAFTSDPLPSHLNKDPELQFVKFWPFNGLPVGIVLRVRPIFDFSASIMGHGEVLIWTGKTQVETTISHGKKTEKDPEKLEIPSNEYGVSLCGKFNISGGVEGFLGFGSAVGTDVRAKIFALGGWISATVDFEGKIQYDFIGDKNLCFSDDCGFALSSNVQWGLKGIGGGWGEYKFIESDKHKIWDGFDVKFSPKVKVNNQIDVIIHEDTRGKYKMFKVKYSYPNLGIYATALNTYFKPRLRVYKGNSTDPTLVEYEDIDPDTKPSWVTSNKEYTFSYKTYDLVQDFTVVPVLYRPTTQTNDLFYDNKRYIDKEIRPIVKFFPDKQSKDYKNTIVYQTWGDIPSVDIGILSGLFNTVAESAGFKQYDFCLPFYMFNATAMSGMWSDFGITYRIEYTDGGKYKNKEKSKSLFSKIKKSGYYCPKISFVSKADYKNVKAQAYLYFVLANDLEKKKIPIYVHESWPFTIEKYAYNYYGSDNDVKKIGITTDLVAPFNAEARDWEIEFAEHNVKNINIDVEL